MGAMTVIYKENPTIDDYKRVICDLMHHTDLSTFPPGWKLNKQRLLQYPFGRVILDASRPEAVPPSSQLLDGGRYRKDFGRESGAYDWGDWSDAPGRLLVYKDDAVVQFHHSAGTENQR